MAIYLLVPADGGSSPGVVLDSTTGATLFTNAAFISRSPQVGLSSELNFAMNTATGGVAPFKIFQWNGDSTFTTLGTLGLGTVRAGQPICAVGVNFWTLTGFNGLNFNTPSWVKFSKTGTVLNGPIGPITFLSNGPTAICVSSNETIGYYSNGFDNTPIHAWDLVNNVALPDFVANMGSAHYGLVSLHTIAGSTDLIAIIEDFNWPTTNSRIIRRYTAAGVVVYDVVIMATGSSGAVDPLAEVAMDPSFTSLWVRWPGPPDYDSFVITRFENLRISDGLSLGFVDIATDDGGPAGTCPLIALGSVTSVGTITVNKVTVPVDSEQSFNVVGTPDPLITFPIGSGGSRTFTNVPVGTYSIVEDALIGWTTSYAVSNGSPNTAITVSADETVTVTITNFSNVFASGIYKIEHNSGKTNDTVYVGEVGATETVKIPDPFATSFLIGE